MKAIFQSDRGKVRSLNEDYGGVFLHEQGHCLLVVADGMGGHQAGDVASRMATEQMAEKFLAATIPTKVSEIEEWLVAQVKEVNEHLFRYASEHEECQGMGTTLIAVVVTNRHAVITHIGDSRLYVRNEDGFQQMTDDHSLVGELMRRGEISKEVAEHHPRKNVILRSLGTEEDVKIDQRTLLLETDDMLLICSDGLTNKVHDEELEQSMTSIEELETISSQLISLANKRGGEDNITLILARMESDEEIEVDPI
ncbi:Stp1/IreP family PP2C-type Ser/Thr phosphatase [Bacillus fonticola]|uniref:Stp1/IreP family PP2C-type Ser/Thr phosphatase n=1 Tax=Bacillus fonticola TaxID=2728853 RepID=UPI00147519C5|nr:Stp1/IreP family PP2C-type Ser/Thr phosphatase [Bacillus fonticola]